MQSTNVPSLGDNNDTLVDSSSGKYPSVLSGCAQATPTSESERESELAASEMHLWWREGSGYHGYRNVAVLLVKWAEHLDDLKCGDEVRRLDEIFQGSFRYHTKVVELHDKDNGNLQLHSAFVEFIREYDGPNNLVIVYYTGHGSQNLDSEQLVLHPTGRIMDTGHSPQNSIPLHAVWEEAEVHIMKNARCDALSILDCCFAGDVQKGGLEGDDRTYQLLSAAGKDRTTKGPGPKSFTTALITSLSQLQSECGNKPFTTLQLQERISNQRDRRDNPSVLWHRLHRYERPIFLAPLTEQSVQAHPNIGAPSRAFLTLRVALEEETLNKDQVVALGARINKAAKSSGAHVRRVDLVSFSVSARKRSLFQIVRTAAIPTIRFMRSLKSETSAIEIDPDAAQLPTTPISRAESPTKKTSLQHGTLESSFGQVQSNHPPQLSSMWNLRKRNRSSTPESTTKKRRSPE